MTEVLNFAVLPFQTEEFLEIQSFFKQVTTEELQYPFAPTSTANKFACQPFSLILVNKHLPSFLLRHSCTSSQGLVSSTRITFLQH